MCYNVCPMINCSFRSFLDEFKIFPRIKGIIEILLHFDLLFGFPAIDSRLFLSISQCTQVERQLFKNQILWNREEIMANPTFSFTFMIFLGSSYRILMLAPFDSTTTVGYILAYTCLCIFVIVAIIWKYGRRTNLMKKSS